MRWLERYLTGGFASAPALRGDHGEPGQARAARRVTDPEFASYLRIEERELEAASGTRRRRTSISDLSRASSSQGTTQSRFGRAS